MTYLPPYRVVVAERDDLLQRQCVLIAERDQALTNSIANGRMACELRQKLAKAEAERDAANKNAVTLARLANVAYAKAFGNPNTWAIEADPNTARVLSLVSAERDRQRQLWGEQTQSPARWLAILAEEFGEAAQLLCRFEWELDQHVEPIPSTVNAICTELIQVAAVAVQIVERIGGEHG